LARIDEEGTMSGSTKYLNLTIVNSAVDRYKYFNIDEMLNNNWNKIDSFYGKLDEVKFETKNYGNRKIEKSSFRISKEYENTVIYMDNTTEALITVSNDSNIDNDTQIILIANSSSEVKFITDEGVNLHSIDNKRMIKGQFSSVTLIKYSDIDWYLIGALK
jgi:hypothetical protein